jgi:hypothetical protein
MTSTRCHWRTMSEKPEKFGWYLVFAPSADPEKPFRQLCFWDDEQQVWTGLVGVWMKALTHWSDWPEDPVPTDPTAYDEDGEGNCMP